MLATMYKAPGIGLAAPQVGVMLRMAVVDIQKDDQQDPMVLINPQIVAESADLATREEGCLSLPNQYADVDPPGAHQAALDGAGWQQAGDGGGRPAGHLHSA
jgi:peptide deformylase